MRYWLFTLAILATAGCASFERLPAVPADATASALPLGLPNSRFFPLIQSREFIAEWRQSLERQRRALGLPDNVELPLARFLAISGGGDNGAFGAGLLVGWTAAGDRPEFQVVTGVSTGALIAPFAFLGPEYDEKLRAVYTTISSEDVFAKRGLFQTIFGDAMTDTTPLWELISRFVDEPMMDAIAREYEKGRLLFIGTTDLDAERANIWNIGAIAASGHPDALDLMRKILRASSAIPGYFQPVIIDVDIEGRQYQELHVDGGAIAQMFLYPPSVELGQISHRRREAYLIRNAHEDPNWQDVQRRTLSVAQRAIATLIQSSGANDMLRIYFVTQRDGVDYNLAYIDSDFTTEHVEDFDRGYMTSLFDYAFGKARQGYAWHKTPPILVQTQR